MTGCRSALFLVAVSLAVLASAALAAPDAEADSANLVQWFEYDYGFMVEDEEYDSRSYSSISWRYSTTPEGLETAEPVYSPTMEVLLDPDEFPLWSHSRVFVKESAVVDGVLEETVIVVNANPISSSCYVLFMYDDVTQYQFSQFYGHTTVKGTGVYSAGMPEDPEKDGYIFEGWYMDQACTEPYTTDTAFIFTQDRKEIYIYPKWTADPSYVPPAEPTEMFSVNVRYVPGLDIMPAGDMVARGESFTIEVTVTTGFKFDLEDLRATTDDGKLLSHTVSGDVHTFTLEGVDRDATVFLSGFVQYFRIYHDLDDVITVGFPEWVESGSALELPLESTTGGKVVAKVYMANQDITGTSYLGGTVRISKVTGDVNLYAHSEDGGTDLSYGIPWWVLVVMACLVVALVAMGVAYKRKNA